MTRALYRDLPLDEEMIRRVRDYVHAVDFHLPGADCGDFEINPLARYLGYMFQNEDLEAYGVGLACTKPGMEDRRTFIRMSRGQLLGEPDAPRLPVNPPVLASDTHLFARLYRDLPGTEARPEQGSRRGVATGVPDDDGGAVRGVEFDLAALRAQLGDILDFAAGRPVYADQEILDLKILWGSLLTGRYPRLAYYRSEGRLSAEQERDLAAFEEEVREHADVLSRLDLPDLDALRRPVVKDG